MRVVAFQREILELKIVDVLHRRIQLHLRQRTRFARELELRLFQMIRVEMQIAEGVDKIARFQVAHLCHHAREQRVAGDVERFCHIMSECYHLHAFLLPEPSICDSLSLRAEKIDENRILHLKMCSAALITKHLRNFDFEIRVRRQTSR